MLNSSNILALIQEDAHCVYDILMEEYFRTAENKWVFPTPDQLLDILKEYSGENYGVHYWSWRYAQMVEDYNSMEDMIRVLEENKQKFAPFMSEEYQLRINTIKNVQEFIWQI